MPDGTSPYLQSISFHAPRRSNSTFEPVTNTTLYSLSKSSVSTLAKEISTPGKCSERNRCEAAGSSASVRGRLFSQAVVRPAASNAISGRIGNFLIRFFRFKAECFFSVQK